MFERERLSTQQIVDEYKKEVIEIAKYLPWLIEKSGGSVVSNFKAQGATESTMSIPVYDPLLLSFVKYAKQTCFMDKNYVYVYTRYRMNTPEDEL